MCVCVSGLQLPLSPAADRSSYPTRLDGLGVLKAILRRPGFWGGGVGGNISGRFSASFFFFLKEAIREGPLNFYLVLLML